MKRFLMLSVYVVASYGILALVIAGLTGIKPSAGAWLAMAIEVLAVGLYTAFSRRTRRASLA